MNFAPLRQAIAPFVPPALLAKAVVAGSTAAEFLRNGGLGELRRNAELRHRYAGRRCFVIGNGPSLKQMPLERLRGEAILTVNDFLLHAPPGLTPLCHTIIDGAYFGDGPERATLTGTAERVSPETMTFFLLQHRRHVEGLYRDPRFVLAVGDIDTNRNGDLTRAIPGLQTVANFSILIALYLGFSKIYVIGCDMSFLSDIVAVNPLRIRLNHFFDERDPTVDLGAKGWDYASYARAILRMFDGFRFVGQLAGPGQQVFNAGVGGLLDVYPRVDFDSLF